MILKDFITDISDELQIYDEEFERLLLNRKIKQIEDQILKFSGLLIKNFETVVQDDLIVRLPYDFKYPRTVKVNNKIVYREESGYVRDYEDTFSILVNRNILSPTKPLRLKANDFEYMNIIILRSSEQNGYKFKLISVDDTIEFGEIYDNENRYYPLSNNNTITPIKIIIEEVDDINRVKDDDILQILTIYGIYEVKLKEGITEYFLAENGFAYSDIDLTALISRGYATHNNLIIKFNNISAGDNIFIEYEASCQEYINKNQDDLVLDTFYNAVFLGCMYEGYMYLNKPQKAREYKQYFNEELQLVQQEAGRINNFGKQKFFHDAERKYRLPFQR